MASGLNKTLGLLERQLYLRRKSSLAAQQREMERSRYAVDATAMEIINSYSHMPAQPNRPLTTSPSPQVSVPMQGASTVYDSHAKVTTVQGELPAAGTLPARKVTQAQKRELKAVESFGEC